MAGTQVILWLNNGTRGTYQRGFNDCTVICC
jgi:hypothetical protein